MTAYLDETAVLWMCSELERAVEEQLTRYHPSDAKQLVISLVTRLLQFTALDLTCLPCRRTRSERQVTVAYTENSSVCDALHRLLSPDGSFWLLLLRLTFGESTVHFEVAEQKAGTTQAPSQVGFSLAAGHDGFVPLKQYAQPTKSSLSAVEFYCFHFALHPKIFRHHSSSVEEQRLGNSLYMALFSEYLDFHFPMTELRKSQLREVISQSRRRGWLDWTVEEKSTSPLCNVSFGHSRYRRFPMGLFKNEVANSFLSPAESSNAFSAVRTPDGQLVGSRTSAAISDEADVSKKIYEFVQCLLHAWAPAKQGASLELVKGEVDCLLCLRFLIKNVHYFVGDGEMDALKSALKSLVRSALYAHFVWLFLHWPMDTSFRVVLETWLSYVQPWRYVCSAGDEVATLDRSAVLRWSAFVFDNEHYYVELLRLAVDRFLLMDLDSAEELQLLLRLIRVFCRLDPLLNDCLGKTGGYNPTTVSCSGREMASSWRTVAKRIFSSLLVKVRRVLLAVERRHQRIRQEILLTKQSLFASWMSHLLGEMTADELALAERDKVLEELNWISATIEKQFKVDAPPAGQVACERSTERVERNAEGDWRRGVMPDSVVDSWSGIRRLTDTGRRQVASRRRRFSFDGAPSLIPYKAPPAGRRWENAALVDLTSRLSRWLNGTAAIQLLAADYEQSSFKGKLARRLFCPPVGRVNWTAFARSPPIVKCRRPQIENSEEIELTAPTINLRPLASYTNIFLLLTIILAVAVPVVTNLSVFIALALFLVLYYAVLSVVRCLIRY